MIWTRSVERSRDIQDGKRRTTGPMTDLSWRGSWSGNERDVLFLNPKGPRFLEAAYSLGVDFDDDGRAVVPVDIDGDGDLDLAIHGLQQLRLLENRMPARRFARVRLVETRGEKHALGAVVHVEAGGVVQQDYMKVTAGFATQVPLELHFGLGDASKIDKLTVEWRDGTKEEFRDLAVDRILTIRRGAGRVEVSEIPRWSDETRPRTLARFSLDATLPKLDGTTGKLVEGKRPVVVNFWAPSCAPCRTELPELQMLSRNAHVVGISTETRDLESVRRMVAEYGLSFPQFVATDAVMKSFFGSTQGAGIPSTFVFDAEGRLRRAFRRAVSRDEVEAVLATFERGHFHADYLIEGLRAMASGQLDEAARAMERSIQENPEYSLAYQHLGRLRVQQKRFEDAVVLFRKAISLAPEYSNARYNLANALLDLDKPVEAERVLREAAALENTAPIRQLIAHALVLQQRNGDAERELRAALVLNPRHLGSLTDLGLLLFQTGRVEEGRDYLRQALEIDPGNKDIRRWLEERSR